MTRQPRYLIAAGLAIVAAGGAVLVVRSGVGAQTPSAEIPALPVQVAPVQGAGGATGDAAGAQGEATFSATIHHDREAQLAFRLPGRIAAYPVRIGDHLPRGGLLVSIEATAYAAASQRAAADLDRARRAAGRYAALALEGAAAGAQASDGADAARAAEAAAQAARYDLQSTRLVMPFAGAVIARRGEVGEVAAAGQSLVTVADTASPLVASVQVPVAVAQGLRAGQHASVALASGQTLNARVLRKAAAADARSGLLQIDLVLPAGSGAVSGTPASARFANGLGAANGSDVSTIPAEAVLEAQGDRGWVYVIDSGARARRKPVGLLGFVDREARITGLAAGARVITKGAGFVSEGQRVTVTP
ncbi:efflux RND transporter periplasmic adaptor subunit [Novosphingobium sp. FKTRR1]|uniref:efflux RND transporter periplasmic adaptor subunit n=1 Tax=Novosphingobium sp. FKTRR1 TaxID=2879118 RepID=UPI001CF0B1E7|nr:efflux RND transporter periplasmic adaptor subunit [Novosphingobium sp. FKTRR1]